MADIIEVPVSKPGTEPDGMTLAEARNVLWIKENARPMGELLDSGYLTVDKLEWAIRSAYSSRMRNAAAVLLGRSTSALTQEAPSPTGIQAAPVAAPMTIAAARNVRWPFHDRMRDVKAQPMGELLDRRLLALKDLSYAVENARDTVVRQAAVTLMLDRLGRAEPPAGPMRVVKSERRSFSEYRQLQLVLCAGILAGVVATSVLFASGVWLWHFVPVWQDPATIARLLSPSGLIAVAVMVAAYWLVNRLATYASIRLRDRFESTLRAYRQGQLGEDRVVEALRAQLDSAWTLYGNLTLPGGKGGDLDFVLVGPTGIWALEVKNYSGAYRYLRNRWERHTSRGWQPFKSSPSTQVRRNARRLHDFLKADEIAQYVNGVVVWANPTGSIETSDCDTPVWRLDRLEEPLAIARSRKALPPERLARIREKLERLTLLSSEYQI